MSNMRNKVQLIGRLGQDPEVVNFDGGKKKANLNLATNSVYYDKAGDKVEETQWHKVVAWGKNAETIEKFLRKGQEVAISGKLTSRSWEDEKGSKRYITEIMLQEFLMLGRKES
ncbi:MAG: single-stranded DNA-binding protein [Bacteroidota bacterium]